MTMKIRTLLVGGLVWLVCAAASPAQDFSGERAMHWLRWQCDLGARVPGSTAYGSFQTGLAAFTDSLGLKLVREEFSATSPLDGKQYDYANLVVSCGPETHYRLWFGAHYDSRAVCDQDPDPARRHEPVLGANDGASGVAVLMHLAEIFAASAPSVGVDLLFFDAEDQGRSSEAETFCLGSQEMARQWRRRRGPLADMQPMGLIVLDMIGDRDLVLTMEATSLHYAGTWTNFVFQRAGELGLGSFLPETGRTIYDDHVPFLLVEVPAVDLIDFDFSPWHTSGDVPNTCSAASLEQVGRLLLDLSRNPPQ